MTTTHWFIARRIDARAPQTPGFAELCRQFLSCKNPPWVGCSERKFFFKLAFIHTINHKTPVKHTVLSASSACRPSSPPWSFCLGFLPWLLIVLFHGIAVAGPRGWTDVQGRTIEAEIIRATDQDVVVKLRDKEVTIPLAKLSEDDQNFVKDWLAENKDNDSSAEAGGPGSADRLRFDGKTLETGGKMNLFEYPYTPEQLKLHAKFKPEPKDTGWKLAISVPDDFDPTKPQRIFIANAAVNNDAQRLAGNVGVFNMYSTACATSGWVCIAYDTNLGRSSHSGDLASALGKLAGEWPDFPKWQFAVGGFSGGAKACFQPLAYLIKRDHNAVGAYLGGCNSVNNCAHWRGAYKAPKAGYRKVKAFASTGKDDNLVPQASAERIVEDLKGEGIRNTRSEFFEGGHTFYKPHFEEALKWFAEQ